MTVLSKSEVAEQLSSVPDWHEEGDNILRQLEFADFVAAMAFVNRVAGEAEKAAHHPDIDIRWNKVRLALSSHDAGGLTEADFKLAKIIDSLA